MDDTQFATEVRIKAPPDLPSSSVEEAISHHREIGKTSRPDLADAIMLARRFTDNGASPQEEARDGGPIEFRSLENVANSDLLLEGLKPQVEDLRVQLFGTTEPPFPDYDDAVEWIENELTKGKPVRSAAQSREHALAFQEELNAFAARWSVLSGFHQQVHTSRLGFKFAHPDRGRVLEFPYWSDSKIPLLHYFVRAESWRTGFPEESLVACILSGVEPTIPDFQIKTPFIYLSGTVPKIQITFNKKNISWNDLRRAYAMIKERFRELPAPVRSEELAIVMAVRKLGGIPPQGQGRMEFWSQVQAKLKEVGIELETSNAVRMRFGRLKKKGINDDLLAGLYRTSRS